MWITGHVYAMVNKNTNQPNTHRLCTCRQKIKYFNTMIAVTPELMARTSDVVG